MADLQAHLNNSPDVTDADVLAYLNQRTTEAVEQGLVAMHPDQFWQAGDMAKFHALRNWWPKDAPVMLSPPYLGVLCRGIATHPTMPRPVPFSDILLTMWQRACMWLAENNRSLENPNESKEERRRRRIRESVARHRKVANSPDPKAAEVQDLYAKYIEACQARKAAVAAVNNEHDPLVKAAMDAWHAAKAELNLQS